MTTEELNAKKFIRQDCTFDDVTPTWNYVERNSYDIYGTERLMEQYHQAKLAEITDADIEAWATNESIRHKGKSDAWVDDIKKGTLIDGAKAMRDGEIKHIKK